MDEFDRTLDRELPSLFRKLGVEKCKNCGERIRGTEAAPDIPIHVLTERRCCTECDTTTMAEWPEHHKSRRCMFIGLTMGLAILAVFALLWFLRS